ncbi:MAG: restriction endonuclease subunit S [Candidatus Delongbacteria bacterium]|nr:restriction endonuclease subunit S [Candidatus Delongbacteria bacterium]
MIAETNLSDIGKRFLLRFGSRYVDFWKSRNGKIFNYNIDTIKMKYVAKFASARVIKKDTINSIYQLIDLANIEPETGFPINLQENITDVIGSDKIYLNDADLAFSKLNSHIGYVFLIGEIANDEFEIIGSTEFYPLIVNSQKIKPKLLKYFLLHNSFREKAVFLRSGKSQSHPRIQRDDFFNLEIPFLELSKQQEIIDKIESIENHLFKQKVNIESLQVIIDEIFNKYLLKTKSLQTYRVENLVTNLNYISNRNL